MTNTLNESPAYSSNELVDIINKYFPDLSYNSIKHSLKIQKQFEDKLGADSPTLSRAESILADLWYEIDAIKSMAFNRSLTFTTEQKWLILADKMRLCIYKNHDSKYLLIIKKKDNNMPKFIWKIYGLSQNIIHQK